MTNTMHKHIEITDKNEIWSCAMHPQIMRAEAGDCPICGMDLIPAEIPLRMVCRQINLSSLRMQWHWQTFKHLL